MADLRRAKLIEAYLIVTTLTGADLSGANLEGVDLSRTMLDGVKGLASCQEAFKRK